MSSFKTLYDCIIRLSKYMHPSSALSHSIQNTSSHGNAFYSISSCPRWSSGGSEEPASYWSADRKASRARKFSLLTWFSTSFGISGIIQVRIAVMPNTMCCSKWQQNKLETPHSFWVVFVFCFKPRKSETIKHPNVNFGQFRWFDAIKNLQALCNARLLIFSHCCTT